MQESDSDDRNKNNILLSILNIRWFFRTEYKIYTCDLT